MIRFPSIPLFIYIFGIPADVAASCVRVTRAGRCVPLRASFRGVSACE